MKLVAIITTAAILSSCGSDKSKDDSSAPDRGYSLIGVEDTKWEQPCKPNEEKDRSKRKFMDLHKTKAIYTMVFYAGTDCKEENKRVSYVRTYLNVMKEVTPQIEGWETFYFELGAYNATVYRVQLLKFFNKYKRYGFDNWELLKAKDVSGLKWNEESEAELDRGAIRSNTILREGDKLYFAKYENQQAVADKSYFYTKRKK